jgi:catechol 2,3-dioxygenase-like lactoylglutathione lyase family enzyme
MRGISHVAIGVREMEKSLTFYGDVLGLRVVKDEVKSMGGMRGVTDNKRRAVRLVWDNGLWATYLRRVVAIGGDRFGHTVETRPNRHPPFRFLGRPSPRPVRAGEGVRGEGRFAAHRSERRQLWWGRG